MKTIKFPEGHWLFGYGFNFELNRVVSYLINKNNGYIMARVPTYKLGRGIGPVEHDSIVRAAKSLISTTPEHQKMYILMYKDTIKLYEKVTFTEIEDFIMETDADISQIYVVNVDSSTVKKVNIAVTFE